MAHLHDFVSAGELVQSGHENSSTLTEEDLDTDSIQAFNISQEAVDTAEEALGMARVSCAFPTTRMRGRGLWRSGRGTLFFELI